MELCCDLKRLDVCSFDSGDSGLGRQKCLGDAWRIRATTESILASYGELAFLLSKLTSVDSKSPELAAVQREIGQEANYLSQLILGLSTYSNELGRFGIIQDSRFGIDLWEIALKSKELVCVAEKVLWM